MPPEQSTPEPQAPLPIVVSPPPHPQRTKVLITLMTILVLGLAVAAWLLLREDKAAPSSSTTANQQTDDDETATATAQGLQLDPAKAYGDKYASGLLPVGDERFVTDAPKKGYIYMCTNNFVPDAQAGAQTRGPWFVGTTQWDINKKYAVQGSVQWQQSITNKLEGSKRVISTNNLPDHVTGVFPVGAADPASAYDRNPNSISEQSLTYTLSARPTYLSTPNCMGGEVGLMLTGVALFNGFDAGGRDAGAWEIQDACEGHPQGAGLYHYHTLSSCIKDIGVGTVIGFALDGYPITGPKVSDGSYLTTDDLDECHGIVSDVTLDGKLTKTYHYVMTQDFPYSASCFRATAAQAPGQHSGGQQTQQQTTGGQPPAAGAPPQGQMPPPKP